MGPAGRSLSLLDPTYASKYIPIIASVSEHQPPAWNSYFTDVHILVLLAPLGLVACFRPMTDASLFLILYGVTAVYFSGVMVGHLCTFPLFALESNIAVWNSVRCPTCSHQITVCLSYVWSSVAHIPVQHGCVPWLRVTTSYTFQRCAFSTQILPTNTAQPTLIPPQTISSLPQ